MTEARSRGVFLAPVLVSLGFVLAVAAIQGPALLNHDVAFWGWATREVFNGAVFGRDILEPNPPLALLIYAPAVAISHIVALDVALKIWVVTLVVAAIWLVWRSGQNRSTGIIIGVAAFVALAFPREFGQREQIAFLLCAPYVLSRGSHSRALSILVGVMAGLGFALKPHFLIPLAMVMLHRRRLGTAELAIAGVGAAYLLCVLLFFRPYLVDMVPLVSATYWGIDRAAGLNDQALFLTLCLAAALPVYLMKPNEEAASSFLAALGFAVAAVAQKKLFPYHFIPAWGFLVLYLASVIESRLRISRYVAIGILSAVAFILAFWSLPWWRDSERRHREVPELVRALGSAESFTVIAVHPYPAFPTALYTDARFSGSANSHWFMPAAAKLFSGEARRKDSVAQAWAMRHAIRDLKRKPEIVVVDSDWSRHTGLKSRSFDGLVWLNSHAAFAKLWQRYEEVGETGRYRIYRLSKNGPMPTMSR